MAEQRVRGLSLRRKVTGWLGAILAVTLVSIGMATAVGRWTSTAFDAMLADNSACYTVQDALAAETKAFSRMVREPSRRTRRSMRRPARSPKPAWRSCPLIMKRSARTATPAPGTCCRAMRATRSTGTPFCR